MIIQFLEGNLFICLSTRTYNLLNSLNMVANAYSIFHNKSCFVLYIQIIGSYIFRHFQDKSIDTNINVNL